MNTRTIQKYIPGLIAAGVIYFVWQQIKAEEARAIAAAAAAPPSVLPLTSVVPSNP